MIRLKAPSPSVPVATLLLALSAAWGGCGGTERNSQGSSATNSSGGSGAGTSTGTGGSGPASTTDSGTGGSGPATTTDGAAASGGSGTTATGGTGGTASGGSGGTGAFPEACVPSTLGGVCDFESPVCGNGTIDSCEICFSSDGGPLTCGDQSEECDASTDQTCEDLGYVGGQLGCTGRCTYDVRGCEWCLGPPRQVTCTVPRVDATNMGPLALAVSGDQLAAAWMSFDEVLYFTRFDSELELLGGLPCAEPGDPGQVALAPSGEGWMMALSTPVNDGEVRLFTVDDQGQPSEVRSIPFAGSALFAELPGEPPLLVYVTTEVGDTVRRTLVAERLDASGQSIWKATLSEGVSDGVVYAAFTGSGFLVGGYHPDVGQRVFPIDVDGQVGTEVSFPEASYPEFAAGGDDRVGALWSDTDGTKFAWLDGAGAFVSDPLLLEPPDATRFLLESTVTVSDGEAIIAIAADTGKEIRVFHVDPSGALSEPGYALARAPTESAWLTGTMDSEGNAVFGWTGTSLVLSKVR